MTRTETYYHSAIIKKIPTHSPNTLNPPDGWDHVTLLVAVYLKGRLAVVAVLFLLGHLADVVVLRVKLSSGHVEDHEATLLRKGRRERGASALVNSLLRHTTGRRPTPVTIKPLLQSRPRTQRLQYWSVSGLAALRASSIQGVKT